MSTTVPKEELRALFASLAELPIAFVIWEGEPKPPVDASNDGRRLILNCIARVGVGDDEEKREYIPDPANQPDGLLVRTTYTGMRVITISVRAENYGQQKAFDLLEDVRTMLDAFDTLDQLSDLSMSLNDIDASRELPDMTAGNRKISVGQMDVKFNQGVDKVVTRAGNTYIENVQVTGAGGLVLAGTDTIDS